LRKIVLLIRFRKKQRRLARQIIAGAFLLFLFFEIGSHSFLDHHSHEVEDHEVSLEPSVHEHHETDCTPSFVCEPSEDHDPSTPEMRDQLSHHDVVVASVFAIGLIEDRVFSAPHTFAPGRAEFQPPTPPFHPPKVS